MQFQLILKLFPWRGRIFYTFYYYYYQRSWDSRKNSMLYATEFVRNVHMKIYLIRSTTRKTTINLNLYQQLNIHSCLYFQSSPSRYLSLLNCCSISLLSSFVSSAFRTDWITTNIFVIGKFDFQISVRICKAKFYFPFRVLWYMLFFDTCCSLIRVVLW